MRKRWVFQASVASIFLASTVFAQEVNTSEFPPAGAAADINKARARGNLMGKSGSPGVGFKECPEGTVEVGNVHIPRGARAPREVITVIEGDVTNVNKGSGKTLCR